MAPTAAEGGDDRGDCAPPEADAGPGAPRGLSLRTQKHTLDRVVTKVARSLEQPPPCSASQPTYMVSVG